ncbi:MAG: chlorite dismutase family protein [Candidatus Rariloculaceae bacterium]|nr:chlorite dismutase family protein [Gammaproteobacteria bacterium]|tara:strand:+ start:5763 stop:6524 length:762 start_codon:yes stop_codon:yes gene_type:complete
MTTNKTEKTNKKDESVEKKSSVDLSEKGTKDGQPISIDRRLFMKFTVFSQCLNVEEAIQALSAAGVEGALYLDANDPKGIGIIALSEDPEYFVQELRQVFSQQPFGSMVHRNEFDMLGRTYSIGYEPNLMDTLFEKPRSKVLDPDFSWAVWYPLQRSKAFYVLPDAKQRQILAEHGSIGKRYGFAGLAADIRLACHGLDKNDNDFIIGLLGPNLFPLSAVVQEMRKTEQTSQFLESLGPFFVGKVSWQSPALR